MNNQRPPQPMPQNCQFSFNDLFSAAKGRDMTNEERDHLYALNQDERNHWVQQHVDMTNGTFITELRNGSDSKTYLAFWKTQPATT